MLTALLYPASPLLARRKQMSSRHGTRTCLHAIGSAEPFANAKRNYTVSRSPLETAGSSMSIESYTAFEDATPDTFPNGSIWFVQEDSGSVWITGDSALVAKADTSNLESWTQMNAGIPDSVGIICLSFVSKSTIFGAGYNGAIYKTTDGGSSWNVVYYNPSLTNFIDNITFFDAKDGFAWGDGLSDSSINACVETTDGGASWTNNNNFIIGLGYPGDMCFTLPSSAFLCGKNFISGTLYYGIWRSTDSGRNWSFSTVGTSSKDSLTYPFSVIFEDSLHGVVCRIDSTFWSTSDGGVTWRQIGSATPTWFDYATLVTGTNTAVFGGNGNATIAEVDLASDSVAIFQDGTKNISFSYVDFPTKSRGYMADGFIRSFYSARLPNVTAIQQLTPREPENYSLSQNYPNPFNPSTTISYQLPRNAFVVLKVYDVLGREVETLVNERQSAGNHSVVFNASNLPSGVYFYRLQSGPYHNAKELLLLK